MGKTLYRADGQPHGLEAGTPPRAAAVRCLPGLVTNLVMATTLFSCDVTRSEHGPDLEAAAVANTAMHPVTGTFADPTLEAAFSVELFGLAYPVHLLLMTFIVAFVFWVALASPPEMQALWGMIMLCVVLGLVGRALLNRMHDSARAQRVGSWTWTVLLVVANVAKIGGVMTDWAAFCELERKQLQAASLVAMAGSLVNGSHGMSFVHKMALVGFVVFTKLLVATPAICQDLVFAYETVALILGAAVAQMAELYLRHSYAEKRRLDEGMDEHRQQLEVEKERLAEENRRVEGKLDEEKEDKRRLEERNEQLQAEKERMLYDLQHRGRPPSIMEDAALHAPLRQPSLALAQDGVLDAALHAPLPPSSRSSLQEATPPLHVRALQQPPRASVWDAALQPTKPPPASRWEVGDASHGAPAPAAALKISTHRRSKSPRRVTFGVSVDLAVQQRSKSPLPPWDVMFVEGEQAASATEGETGSSSLFETNPLL